MVTTSQPDAAWLPNRAYSVGDHIKVTEIPAPEIAPKPLNPLQSQTTQHQPHLLPVKTRPSGGFGDSDWYCCAVSHTSSPESFAADLAAHPEWWMIV